MAHGVIRGSRNFDSGAHQLIKPVSEKRLAAVTALAGRMIGNQAALSTVFDGERPTGLSPETEADLADLEAALPDGTLLRDPITRDRFGTEPAMISFIRQLEGKAPQTLAVLAPENADAAAEAVGEARALGFSFVAGERQLGICVPETIEVVSKPDGVVRFMGGTSWDAFGACAATAGLSTMSGLRQVWPTPMAAAEAGAFGRVTRRRLFGTAWSAEVALPPSTVGVSALTWIFSEADGAAHAAKSIARQLAPLHVETLPVIGAALLSEAGLVPKHKRLRDGEGRLLRCQFAGIEPVRRAVTKAAKEIAQRTGGSPYLKEVPADRNVADALLAASGAAQLIRRRGLPIEIAEGARTMACEVAVCGRLTAMEHIVYLRDLSRSVPEAQRLCGLPEDAPAPVMALEAADEDDSRPETVAARG